MANRRKSVLADVTEDPLNLSDPSGATGHDLAAELARVADLRARLETELAEVAQLRERYEQAPAKNGGQPGYLFWQRCSFCLQGQWWDVRDANSIYCRSCEAQPGSDWVYAMATKHGLYMGIPDVAPERVAWTQTVHVRNPQKPRLQEIDIPGAIGE